MKRFLPFSLLLWSLIVLTSGLFPLHLSAQAMHSLPRPVLDGVPLQFYKVLTTYDGKLCLAYSKTGYDYYLTTYDGTEMTLIPTPQGTSLYLNDFDPIQYNGKLYLSYKDQSTTCQLAQFDGKTITLIHNPVEGSSYPVRAGAVYNNKLYFVDHGLLAQFDGTAITVCPNQGNDYSMGGPTQSIIVYNGKLLLANGMALVEYDGTSFKTISPPGRKYLGDGVIFNNKLFMRFNRADGAQTPIIGEGQLAVYDGMNLSFIPETDARDACVSPPFVYNNKIYIVYLNRAEDQVQLAECDGKTFTLIDNPTGGGVTWYSANDNFIIYKNKLYLHYVTGAHIAHLAGYDGKKLTLVPNPDSALSVPAPGPNAFLSYPYVFNNTLYYTYSTNIIARYDGVTVKLTPITSGAVLLEGPFEYKSKLYTKFTPPFSIEALKKKENTMTVGSLEFPAAGAKR